MAISEETPGQIMIFDGADNPNRLKVIQGVVSDLGGIALALQDPYDALEAFGEIFQGLIVFVKRTSHEVDKEKMGLIQRLIQKSLELELPCAVVGSHEFTTKEGRVPLGDLGPKVSGWLTRECGLVPLAVADKTPQPQSVKAGPQKKQKIKTVEQIPESPLESEVGSAIFESALKMRLGIRVSELNSGDTFYRDDLAQLLGCTSEGAAVHLDKFFDLGLVDYLGAVEVGSTHKNLYTKKSLYRKTGSILWKTFQAAKTSIAEVEKITATTITDKIILKHQPAISRLPDLGPETTLMRASGATIFESILKMRMGILISELNANTAFYGNDVAELFGCMPYAARQHFKKLCKLGMLRRDGLMPVGNTRKAVYTKLDSPLWNIFETTRDALDAIARG